MLKKMGFRYSNEIWVDRSAKVVQVDVSESTPKRTSRPLKRRKTSQTKSVKQVLREFPASLAADFDDEALEREIDEYEPEEEQADVVRKT